MFEEEFFLLKIKVYNIDSGSFDAIKLENLYYIIKKFIELKPLAIKVQLASIFFFLRLCIGDNCDRTTLNNRVQAQVL